MDIYIFLGQSNMSGRGNISDLPTHFPLHQGRLFKFRYSPGDWEPALEPLQDAKDPVYSVNADRQGGVGPALAFADKMAEYSANNIGIILCARGGTPIGKWKRSKDPLSLYGALMNRALTARLQGRIRGIVVHHGEGNTKNNQIAYEWQIQFLELIKELRKDLGLPELPVVFAQLADISDARREKHEHGFSAWDLLKALQENICENNVEMVKTDDLELIDGLHLNTKSQLILGCRFAEKMHKMQKDL